MKNMKLVIFVISTLVVHLTYASIIMQHSGSTDPFSEGWEFFDYFGPAQGDITTGAINDGGTPAWYVDDNSTVYNGMYNYVYYMTDQDVVDGVGNGWSMDLSLRVADLSDSADASIAAAISYNNTIFSLFFGSQADGDPIIRVGNTGPSFSLEGLGAGYHDYSVLFDPIQQNADLLVDGVEILSDYEGEAYSSSLNMLRWGSISSPDQGHGNFSSVTFAVPEPSSFILIGLGGILMFRMRKWIRIGIYLNPLDMLKRGR